MCAAGGRVSAQNVRVSEETPWSCRWPMQGHAPSESTLLSCYQRCDRCYGQHLLRQLPPCCCGTCRFSSVELDLRVGVVGEQARGHAKQQ